MPEPVTIMGVGGGAIGFSAYLARRHFELAKEVFDIVLGCILLVALSPLIGLCALAIKCSDGGPVFFVQTRLGRGGKPFRMIKLRTMYQDAEKASGAMWACKGDPRVIPLCRWMRRSHVDELPQLINVIRGDMSLVGPRPERPEIMTELERLYPHIRRRLAVRPGITGLAQVRDGYDTSIEHVACKLRSDLEYIERRRWSMELSILARTLTKVNDKTAH